MLALAYQWYAWFLLALGVPIVIHLIYGIRKKRVPTGAIWMIRQVLERNARRLRLRDVLLLLLRVAAVTLAVLAFARPLGWMQPAAEKHYLVVLDDSYLTRARQAAGDTVFETLRTGLLAKLPATGRFRLFTASGRMEGDYEDRRSLAVALRGIEPSWHTWDAAALLRRLPADERADGAYVALSDDRVPAALDLAIPVAAEPVIVSAALAPGVAIAAFEVSPAPLSAKAEVSQAPQARLTFRVLNTYAEPVKATLSVRAENQVLASVPVEVPAGGGDTAMTASDLAGPWFIGQAELDVPDALPEDNRFHLALKVREAPAVHLVAGEHREPLFASPDYYLLRALEAGGRFRVRRYQAADFREPVAAAPGTLQPPASSFQPIVVLVSPDVLARQRIVRMLEAGVPVLMFQCGRAEVWEGVTVSSVGPGASGGGVEVSPDGPLAAFSADALAIVSWAKRPLVLDERWQCWLKIDGVPAVFAHRQQPLVVVNSYATLAGGDLVRQRVFVPLVQALVQRLAGGSAARLDVSAARVGHALEPPSSPLAPQPSTLKPVIEVTAPTAARYRLEEGGEFRYDAPGLYRLAQALPEGREEVEYVAVNLEPPVAAAERVPVAGVFRAAPPGATGARALDETGRAGPWRLIALTLLALLAAELMLGALPLVRPGGRRR